MQIPVQVTFRNMDPSEAVEANVRGKAEKLERFFDRVVSCRVVVESPHRRHHKGFESAQALLEMISLRREVSA